MKLARIFQDGMIVQRHKPIKIWGESEKEQEIEVKLNEELIYQGNIPEGTFSFYLPAQKEMEDATLEIGEHRIHNVDIGEVWLAGGQSNMEFKIQYTPDGEEEIASANDRHLRTYVVGQYAFKGEREEGYKTWNEWDKWLTYSKDSAPRLPAVAIHFAKELRKQNVPLGIVSCNWGGTSASTWIHKEYLLEDEDLKTYIDDFEEIVAKLDLDSYYKTNKIARMLSDSPESQDRMAPISKNTFHPEEMNKLMLDMQNLDPSDDERKRKILKENPDVSLEDMQVIGPNDKNNPSTLYENMLKEVLGYGIRGVIWYQGESDAHKPDMYSKLFSKMIECWRRDWQEEIPFLFVQLAPFGTWLGGSGEVYPILRRQQELVSKRVPNVYMTSISDIGNVYDIHPKEKKLVGQRLALLAKKYAYQEDILADPPEAETLELNGDKIKISFHHGTGLYKKEADFESYNGFHVSEIDKQYLPPVLDGVNGLKVFADEIEIVDGKCHVEEDMLIVQAKELREAKEIRLEFAETNFYQVNINNAAGLPVKPFRLEYVKTM